MTEGKRSKQIWDRDSRFPKSLFGIYLGVLCLMSGLHQGLIVGMDYLNVGGILTVHITIAYWLVVAAVLTLFTRWRVRKTYDEPLQQMADATEKVAKGDFSVYIAPTDTIEKYDYLDWMILDFNKMVEELGSVETLKTDFVSNVSHEMKTPIAVIQSYAELMKADQLPESRRKEYAQAIMNASARLSDLISNILKLNRLENQNITPEIRSYDVCRQLTDCILQFEKAWDKKELDLQIDMEEAAIVMADESLMELVWNNLLSNAVKFTECDGTVTIRQQSDRQFVTVSISDTGCGISSEAKAHIFDKFYQGDTSHAAEGNGLGLALAKRVVDLMGGDITVMSEEGKGSTFQVRIPAPSGNITMDSEV
ncbi:MAG: HAMP domain-containing histidine kinase [Oscillospiraceae bacterium]|nr:HAMP domain-containing histidine kinase [Oscillospiraceae bacterium]